MAYSKFSNGFKQCPNCGYKLHEIYGMNDSHKIIACNNCGYSRTRKVKHAWEVSNDSRPSVRK